MNNKKKEKRKIISYYNLIKGGVDTVDGAAGVYSTQRKTYKWWHAIFFYLLEASQNASIIFFQINPHTRSNMLYFRRTLYESYFSTHFLPKSIGLSKIEVHFPIFLEKTYSCFFVFNERKKDKNI